MDRLLLALLSLHTVSGLGHWCEQEVQQHEEHFLSPRLQLEVSCSDVYRFDTWGWRLDVDRMRTRHGSDDAIALYYRQQGVNASCFLYKPPQMETQVVNKTVRSCCEGWAGPRCSEGIGGHGQCFSTWSCEDFPGVHNMSLMSVEQCCSSLWARSWRNASDLTCTPCTAVLPSDSQSSPLVRSGPLTTVRVRQGSSTCMSWGGTHYRTFDRRHFNFQGRCTYVLSSSEDGTWILYISTECDGSDCRKVLRMMLGLDLVLLHQGNVTVNQLLVPKGEALFQNGVSVYWLGDFVLVESSLGVRLKWDLVNTVYVTVTAEHFSATRGLCGVYNNDPEDDFTTASGAQSQYAASFGNSWRVPDQTNPDCSDAAELGHPCDVFRGNVVHGEAASSCGRLLEAPFTACHQRLDPAIFMEACLYLYCSLSPQQRGGAVCDAMTAYVRECAQQHVLLSWRTTSLCARFCPRGQVFSDCVSSCPPTCSIPQPPGSPLDQCRDECVGGCECPPGLYLHQGDCVNRDQCPCYHRRRTYSPGDRVQQRCNTCECTAGQWHCSKERCAAQCSLMGALQVNTFDNKRYTLQGGDCPLMTVEDFVDRKLVVVVRSGPCAAGGGGGGCVREMSVTALHTSVTLTDTGTVTLNGRREALPVVTADLLVLRVSSSFLLVQTFGAQLLWNLEGTLIVIRLEPGFANKVRGLCGTFSWSQHDDFTTPQGDVENSVSSFAAKLRTEPCTLPWGHVADPCTTYSQRMRHAESLCAIIHSAVFEECHDRVEREPYVRACLSEVCGCAAHTACHCAVITEYARLCAEEGAAASWRNQTFCPTQCSGGQVYQECGRACGVSCLDLQLALSCDDGGGGGHTVCVPGCQCPDGLVQDLQGQCVPAELCPCVHGGHVYPAGAVLQHGCNSCVCEQGQVKCTQQSCEELSVCPGPLIFSPRSCLLTCSSLDLPGLQQDSIMSTSSCREPLSGCVCPEGTVLLEDGCVLPEECPCHHNGKLYFTNDTIRKDCNTCVCRERRWHCTQLVCTGVCVCTGDPHYMTFDGRSYSFLGDCQYVLTRENSGLFAVTAENVPCGSSGVTCTKSVTLTLGNTVVHLLRGKAVTVNGRPVTLPKSYGGSGLTLQRLGLFVSLSSRLGVALLWDGGMRVYVRVAAHLRGQVGGLCGNFDGDTENDFTTQQGVVESTAELFGNSWKVSPSCPDVAEQDLQDPCTVNPHRVTWAKRRCGVLTQELFSACHTEVPVQQFYDWCVFDACGCDSGGDCECLCTAIAAYAEECNRQGVYIHWRSQELCPLQCENGMQYQACGPACSEWCPSDEQSPQSQCEAVSCVEGCFCPPGTVRHAHSCVTPHQCPCEWDGSMFPPHAAVTRHCQNCSCENGVWQCEGVACPPPPPPCEGSEFMCAGGRCIPSQWVCDNQDDCGDGSDEVCPSTCSVDQFTCSSAPSGPCLNRALRCDGHHDCVDQSDEEMCVGLGPSCPPGDFQCANGKCVHATHVCDGRLDCGFADGSDEEGCGVHCREDQFQCAGGRCVLYVHRCDGHDDCGDLSDERRCVCAPGQFQCPEDQCVPAHRVCDGVPDCPSGTDEAVCRVHVTCAPGQFSCSDGTCVSGAKLCDGTSDCPEKEDESSTNCPPKTPSVTTATPASVCRSFEFSCETVDQCVPVAWHCDGETDCMDGSDEQQCGSACGPEQVQCSTGEQCVGYQQLCDGTADCWDASDESIDKCGSSRIPPCPDSFSCDNQTCVNMTQVCNGVPDCPRGEDEMVCDKIVPSAAPAGANRTCPEFTCLDGTCVPFHQVCNGLTDCPDETLSTSGAATDEHGCLVWSSWGSWSSCSSTCGPGSMSRRRSCPQGDPLHYCRGQDVQRQQCFNTTCPVDGRWLPWGSWSNCSRGCGAVRVRHRGCIPPRHRGRQCPQLPGLSKFYMEIKPCPNKACANTTCPSGLVRHTCGPCPLTCSHISSGTTCEPSTSCFSGCWCPEGQVMSHTQQCVSPSECSCLLAGVRYWPGQKMKVDCEVCVCERGRPQRCQTNLDCSVHCGWSSWSSWGECLGPCGVQSVQWSFRSPVNPHAHGDKRACRGIYRKARRCQTDPCGECAYGGQSHAVGDRWKSKACELCSCLPNLRVQCAPYCAYAVSGCPKGERLVPAEDDTCCHCSGERDTTETVTAKPTPAGGATPLLPTFPLVPGVACHFPLGVQTLPDSSFHASSQQDGHPAEAARLHGWDTHRDLQGWSPDPDEYKDLPQHRPEGRLEHLKPYIQIDLLRSYNITGVLTQGGGGFHTYVSSFFLQFSLDGTLWFTYKELTSDKRLRAKVFLGNHDDGGVAEVWLDRMVSARFVRLLPYDFHNGIYLRLEIMGCSDDHWFTSSSPPFPTPAPIGCTGDEFLCGNGRCVPAGHRGVLCDGVNDCEDGSDETFCGTLASSTAVSAHLCPEGQFSCPPPGGCIASDLLCDGIWHCPSGVDEQGCPSQTNRTTLRPPPPTAAPLGTPAMAAITHPAPTSAVGGPDFQGICSSPLGLEDGRVRYGQLTSSSQRENNPADAGRLNIVPNIQVMEPGWSPLPTDPYPYLEVDFVEPTWVSGLVLQGSESRRGYLTKYKLAFALHSGSFTDYTENGEPGGPAQVFTVRMVGRTPVTRWLGRLVSARYMRIIPTEFRHTFYLRVEVLGCRGGTFQTTPGIQNNTLVTGQPSFHGDRTTGAPGLHWTQLPDGLPGVAPFGLPEPTEPVGLPGMHNSTSLHPGRPGLQTTAVPSFTTSPRSLCGEGQFSCRSLGCVDSAQVCDGSRDCSDGSDEERCVKPDVTPSQPRPTSCSSKQFSCQSGECVPLDRSCDLHRDCLDGSDERDCLDCILSSWTTWSACSTSCGLGSLFRQRDVVREALPGGICGEALFDRRPCFTQACPVHGHWSEWADWSQCDVECGGGVRQRNRSCSTPPPKNGGRQCEGMSRQSQSCNVQPCTTDTGTQTGCVGDMVLVTEEDCQTGRVESCPPTCSELSGTPHCSSGCVHGCRCPSGRFLQDGQCVNSSQCVCVWEDQTLQPGQAVTVECETCLCSEGRMSCDTSGCLSACHWSAWSSWSPCDQVCGLGLQQRYRSPLLPAAADRAQPCPGDSSETRPCSNPCPPDGVWIEWTSWSDCSKTCFNHVDDVGVRRRFYNCTSTHVHPLCAAGTEEVEPCNPVHCAVHGGWSPWSQWSLCSSQCDSGVQTRDRVCSSPAPQHGGATCPGPHIQTRDCNSQPCSGVCPQGMVYMRSVACEAQGGACPRVCMDVMSSEVECSTSCYDGCYCTQGLYLLNNSCVPLAHCPCYHQGETYPAGHTMLIDACNNCTCRDGQMACSSRPCPVDCGWSIWTQWSTCSRTCDVGVRRRYRSGTDPSPSFGGRPCTGDRVGIDTCSVEPCLGLLEPWGVWSGCSVTCGGGYRSRTRGPIRVHGTAHQFSACNLQPCGTDRVCPSGQQWSQCVTGPVSCMDLTMDLSRNCTPGCTCPHGTVLQDSVCVPERECRCHVEGEQVQPGEKVSKNCNNCTCDGGRLVNCSQLVCNEEAQWSAWTPWGQCSASCGPGLQSRYRFCPSLQLCLGHHREDKVCVAALCDRDGGWSQWSTWSQCSKSCGRGARSRRRSCDSPTPEGGGASCRGQGAQTSACNTQHCPVSSCSLVRGSVFSSCGPSCPRSCDDLSRCEWSCEPGCYCTGGKLLSSNGTACVHREDCPCLDLSTGRRMDPGEMTPSSDGCNNCTCEAGELSCTTEPCPVSGGWCEWSDWTPCSRTCGLESVSRYRSCSCPETRAGGAPCPAAQETHSGVGVQIQTQPCPVISYCPVHGAWGSWSAWSQCEGCEGSSVRTRTCTSPPARFGGLPCLGAGRQVRGCHDNMTECSDCGGGQVEWTCGRLCPRSCSDLHGDTECVDSAGCSVGCGCPGDLLLQDGQCVDRDECRCLSPGGVNSTDSTLLWSEGADRQLIDPGDSIIHDCMNCSCQAGILVCRSSAGCAVDGGWGQWGPWTRCSLPCGGGTMLRKRVCDNPAPQGGARGCVGVAEQQRECNTQQCPESEGLWRSWSEWSECSVSCGGGQQSRSRLCSSARCHGLSSQSRTCNSHVCLDVGCPPGRLYRECDGGEGCPFSCAHITGAVGCYSDGCDEGCHCPPHTYQHLGLCLAECPCVVDQELLDSLSRVSLTPASLTMNISVGMELQSADAFAHECSNCSCEHGRWTCSLISCPVHGGLSPWTSWTSCSVSCGGLGTKTRSRSCTHPAPAHGGRDCEGSRRDSTQCEAPVCPETVSTEGPPVPDSDSGFSLWSSWTPCSQTCMDILSPATKSRQRQCVSPPCSGSSNQEKVCNLPQCPGELCVTADCARRNCSWMEWGKWASCSRSCGVGEQQRIRTFVLPGSDGLWCEDILGGNVEHRFCNVRPCRVDGGWSRWSPWSRCDKQCGGGRSRRTRSCSSPPPKNGGAMCEGEKNQVKPCNSKPCEETGCPPGQEVVSCANRCPQLCSDLQPDLKCQHRECEPGCGCPEGQLLQDDVCVHLWQCDCVDSGGQMWASGSSHQVGCNTCSCSDGQLLCTNHSCPSACVWSSWSSWAPCSVSCGLGQRTRYRSQLADNQEESGCEREEVQHKACNPGLCPPLCVHGGLELSVGDTWLQGECLQCTCTPEGDHCQHIECTVDGGWTPWSVWSDCSVTCSQGTRVRTRACINPPPRNNGSRCSGPEKDTELCQTLPCLEDLCSWSPWSTCSQSCGSGFRLRRQVCVCESGGDIACPAEVEALRVQEESQMCYNQPCAGCPRSAWSVWSRCSCESQRQQRYRVALTSATRGQHCTPVDMESRPCSLLRCEECKEPFVFLSCGSPCDKHCELHGREDLCSGDQQCTPGCYCPQGLLQLNGSCVVPDRCGCAYLQHDPPPPPHTEPPSPVLVPLGAVVTIGCSTCLCHAGSLQCDMRECEVILSEWSEWTSCSPCAPSSSLDGTSPSVGGADAPTMVSIQRRFRACLDMDLGLPVSKDEERQCDGALEEETVCPHADVCTDLCRWSVWSSWTSCSQPCSGGVRQRFRQPQVSSSGPPCPRPHTQSQACNVGLCPGEQCEDRGRDFHPSCANQCPRSCTDLWEHVQCLQGSCHQGCRCPEGQLLQDGHCIPLSQCRCGVPSSNGTLQFLPEEEVTTDCNTCLCENGTLHCSNFSCPLYEPWSSWSSCSASCGPGHRRRTRTCQEVAGGPPCADTSQTEQCDQPSCPAPCVLSDWSSWSECSASCGAGVTVRNRTVVQEEEPGGATCTGTLQQQSVCNHNQSCTTDCPSPLVYTDCVQSCPYTCEDLWPHVECLPAPCTSGCMCPSNQVLHGGSCVSLSDCPCSPVSLFSNQRSRNSSSEMLIPAGASVQHLCNTCVCRAGVLDCPPERCEVDCRWSTWSQWTPCSSSCGSGQQSSSRTILEHSQYGGAPCEGGQHRSRLCSAPACACPDGEHWRRRRRTSKEVPLCERSCEDIYSPSPSNCSSSTEACVCDDGLYRNNSVCVIPALCPCHDQGMLKEPGSQWEEDCLSCRCLNGRKVCQPSCPPPHCVEGEVMVEEPGSCCPVCRRPFPDEPLPECQRYVQVQNISKGNCHLDNVEVSFCRGRCLSRTNVLLEEPYLQSVCECCSYRLDPQNPVRFLSLQCDSGISEPVVLPVIHSCECTSCQGGDLSKR